MYKFTFLVVTAVLTVAGVLALPSVINVADYKGNFKKVDVVSTNDGQKVMASYYISNFRATWEESNDTCVRLIEKNFVSVQNRAKHDDIIAAMEAAGSPSAWTSGRFASATDVFMWTGTGLTFSYTSWYEGYYNYNFQTNPCVLIDHAANIANHNWRTARCDRPSYFICE